MDNTGPDHDWREHACLRVQWVLAGRHGLRARVRADDRLPRVLGSAVGRRARRSHRSHPSRPRSPALRRAAHPPWAPALGDALAATARIAAAAAPLRRRRRRPSRALARRRAPARAAPDRPPRRRRRRLRRDLRLLRVALRSPRRRALPPGRREGRPGVARAASATRPRSTARPAARAAARRTTPSRSPARSGGQGAAVASSSIAAPTSRSAATAIAAPRSHGGTATADPALSLRDLRRPPAHLPRLHARLRRTASPRAAASASASDGSSTCPATSLDEVLAVAVGPSCWRPAQRRWRLG